MCFFYDLALIMFDAGQCVPQNIVFFVVILTFNLLTDLCIMLVPIPVRSILPPKIFLESRKFTLWL